MPNILLLNGVSSFTQFEAVIFDFEMSKILVDIAQESNTHDTFTRSPSLRWAAPELGTSNRRMDEISDVWSFGLVMVEVFTLNIPWPEYRRNETVQLYVARHGMKPSRPASDWVTDEVWAIIQDCCKDRDDRPKMQNVERRLREAEQYRKDNPPPPPSPPPPRSEDSDEFAWYMPGA